MARRGDTGRKEPLELFKSRRDLMATLFGVNNLLTGHPVELNCAPRSGDRLVSVPRIVRALEDQERSAIRRHFGDVVVEVIRPAQQAQTSRVLLPTLVHV